MIGRYRDGAVPDVERRPRARGRLRRPRRRGREPARPRGDHPGARAHLAARAAAEPLRRGAGAVEAGEGPRARRPSSTRTLRSLAEGLRVRHRAAAPLHARVDREAARRARRRADSSSSAARVRRRPRRRRRVGELPPLFPKPAVIDRHTHLDHGPAPEDELVAAAREAGVNRILTIGMDSRALPRGARRRRALRRGLRRGRPPPQRRRRASTTPTAPSCASSPHHPRCLAIGETGLDFYRDRAPREDQERAFRAQIELARDDRQAARHPHARGRGRHDRHARARRARASR